MLDNRERSGICMSSEEVLVGAIGVFLRRVLWRCFLSQKEMDLEFGYFRQLERF